jgi:hypothetical protein
LSPADAVDERRKELLYQRWKKQVYSKVQTSVRRIVDSRSVSEVESDHRRRFQEYLDADGRKKRMNAKSGVFLNVIVDDYDPIVPEPRDRYYRQSHLDDPLKNDGPLVRAENKWVLRLFFL